MSDNLRDRIAAAIDQKYSEEAIGHTYEVCLHAADAVIRELGNLRKEPHRFQCGSGDCHRYRIISDWTTNE